MPTTEAPETDVNDFDTWAEVNLRNTYDFDALKQNSHTFHGHFAGIEDSAVGENYQLDYGWKPNDFHLVMLACAQNSELRTSQFANLQVLSTQVARDTLHKSEFTSTLDSLGKKFILRVNIKDEGEEPYPHYVMVEAKKTDGKTTYTVFDSQDTSTPSGDTHREKLMADVATILPTGESSDTHVIEIRRNKQYQIGSSCGMHAMYTQMTGSTLQTENQQNAAALLFAAIRNYQLLILQAQPETDSKEEAELDIKKPIEGYRKEQNKAFAMLRSLSTPSEQDADKLEKAEAFYRASYSPLQAQQFVAEVRLPSTGLLDKEKSQAAKENSYLALGRLNIAQAEATLGTSQPAKPITAAIQGVKKTYFYVSGSEGAKEIKKVRYQVAPPSGMSMLRSTSSWGAPSEQSATITDNGNIIDAEQPDLWVSAAQEVLKTPKEGTAEQKALEDMKDKANKDEERQILSLIVVLQSLEAELRTEDQKKLLASWNKCKKDASDELNKAIEKFAILHTPTTEQNKSNPQELTGFQEKTPGPNSNFAEYSITGKALQGTISVQAAETTPGNETLSHTLRFNREKKKDRRQNSSAPSERQSAYREIFKCAALLRKRPAINLKEGTIGAKKQNKQFADFQKKVAEIFSNEDAKPLDDAEMLDVLDIERIEHPSNPEDDLNDLENDIIRKNCKIYKIVKYRGQEYQYNDENDLGFEKVPAKTENLAEVVLGRDKGSSDETSGSGVDTEGTTTKLAKIPSGAMQAIGNYSRTITALLLLLTCAAAMYRKASLKILAIILLNAIQKFMEQYVKYNDEFSQSQSQSCVRTQTGTAWPNDTCSSSYFVTQGNDHTDQAIKISNKVANSPNGGEGPEITLLDKNENDTTSHQHNDKTGQESEASSSTTPKINVQDNDNGNTNHQSNGGTVKVGSLTTTNTAPKIYGPRPDQKQESILGVCIKNFCDYSQLLLMSGLKIVSSPDVQKVLITLASQQLVTDSSPVNLGLNMLPSTTSETNQQCLAPTPDIFTTNPQCMPHSF